MAEQTTHRLGDIAYTISADGRVHRTAVSALSVETPKPEIDTSGSSLVRFMSTLELMGWDPPYEFLNDAHDTPHTFDLDEAIAFAKTKLEKRIADPQLSRQAVQEDELYLSTLDTSEGRQAILEQPLHERSRLFGHVGSVRDISPDAFPKDYFQPGQKVFGIVTPNTHYLMSPNWRPRLYFILEEEVHQVAFAAGWPDKLRYEFSQTNYALHHSHLYTSEAAARAALAKLFTEQTEGTIDPEKLSLFTARDEKTWCDETHKRISEQVREHFEHAQKYF